jgi:hypothetical protein
MSEPGNSSKLRLSSRALFWRPQSSRCRCAEQAEEGREGSMVNTPGWFCRWSCPGCWARWAQAAALGGRPALPAPRAPQWCHHPPTHSCATWKNVQHACMRTRQSPDAVKGACMQAAERCAHSSNTALRPMRGNSSRRRASPVAVSATHSSSGCLGGSPGPPAHCMRVQSKPFCHVGMEKHLLTQTKVSDRSAGVTRLRWSHQGCAQ